MGKSWLRYTTWQRKIQLRFAIKKGSVRVITGLKESMKCEMLESEFVQIRSNALQDFFGLSSLQMSTILRGVCPLLKPVGFWHKYKLEKQPKQLDLVITRHTNPISIKALIRSKTVRKEKCELWLLLPNSILQPSIQERTLQWEQMLTYMLGLRESVGH